MKNFVTHNKKAIIILLAALIIIGTAWYFTLGSGNKDQNPTEGESAGTPESGGTGSTTTIYSGTRATFPLKWGVRNTNTVTLQKRLNLSIACYNGTALFADGVLGQKTVEAIKRSFPTIGANVESTRQVSQSEYSSMINSQPSCLA